MLCSLVVSFYSEGDSRLKTVCKMLMWLVPVRNTRVGLDLLILRCNIFFDLLGIQ